MNSILVQTIVCPGCQAELGVHCEICPNCRTPQRAPVANGLDGEQRDESPRTLDRPWVIVVLLLHVGFLGIPLYWKTRYALGTRVLICVISVAYTVFAVGFIGLVGSWLWRVFTGG